MEARGEDTGKVRSRGKMLRSGSSLCFWWSLPLQMNLEVCSFPIHALDALWLSSDGLSHQEVLLSYVLAVCPCLYFPLSFETSCSFNCVLFCFVDKCLLYICRLFSILFSCLPQHTDCRYVLLCLAKGKFITLAANIKEAKGSISLTWPLILWN